MKKKLDKMEINTDNPLNILLSNRTNELPVDLPEYDKTVLAVVKGFSSGKQQYAVLKAVKAEDHVWVFNDDGAELSNSYDVISWIYLPPL